MSVDLESAVVEGSEVADTCITQERPAAQAAGIGGSVDEQLSAQVEEAAALFQKALAEAAQTQASQPAGVSGLTARGGGSSRQL